ncbi:hypothetical protein DAPPUDRAFT_317762 [Daphnia pulex]|uniref:Uncharacterized protein n=1 Tax=Daphnia pulex TaxID=6669 RepID=E9GGW7_DAPPU|nr:hypothetical protein DAPPUDRAFT_317762 [Daphnia pulex]|eukprot:EFX81096.1 hypothetical protein DAPPUDRAFT_317762 [Daphnia pulex]
MVLRKPTILLILSLDFDQSSSDDEVEYLAEVKGVKKEGMKNKIVVKEEKMDKDS